MAKFTRSDTENQWMVKQAPMTKHISKDWPTCTVKKHRLDCYTSMPNNCTRLAQIASRNVDKYAMLPAQATLTP